MNGEINRGYYCANGRNKNKQKDICHNSCSYYPCEAYHRKWPTPEQFKEEYREDYPDDGAVWFRREGFESTWWLNSYGYLKAYPDEPTDVVCACTPWGEPPDDWRME